MTILLMIWQDDDLHYCYAPQLDLAVHGATEQEAQGAFAIAFQSFLEYTDQHESLHDALQDLKWTFHPRQHTATAPDENAMILNNHTFRNLILQSNAKQKATTLNGNLKKATL